jgi:hypothetical protein
MGSLTILLRNEWRASIAQRGVWMCPLSRQLAPFSPKLTSRGPNGLADRARDAMSVARTRGAAETAAGVPDGTLRTGLASSAAAAGQRVPGDGSQPDRRSDMERPVKSFFTLR